MTENEVIAAPVVAVTETEPAQEWANTYHKGDADYKACPKCRLVNIKVQMNCCLDCADISHDGEFISTVSKTGRFYGHKGHKYGRVA